VISDLSEPGLDQTVFDLRRLYHREEPACVVVSTNRCGSRHGQRQMTTSPATPPEPVNSVVAADVFENLKEPEVMGGSR
jgi:hypothetical protein